MRFLILLCFLFSTFATAQVTIKSDVEKGREYSTGLLHSDVKTGQLHYRLNTLTGYPLSLDLRTQGFVSAIKDQGSCGSCWSFAIVKSLESARLKAGLPELDLAEQQMVSCDKKAFGCGGGFMSNADYSVSPGISLESGYKYTGTNSRCKSPLPATADKAKSWAYIGKAGKKPTKDELKAAINTYGVIFVTVSAGGTDWGGSRVHMTGCTNRGTNHMVTLVGYNDKDEFIIGNSWGKNWAEAGFAYAKQGCNNLANEVNGAAFLVYEGGVAPMPPNIRLPASILVMSGTDLLLGVMDEHDVIYEWSDGTNIVGTNPTIWVTPTVDTVYKLTAKNAAGTAESTVEVKVISE